MVVTIVLLMVRWWIVFIGPLTYFLFLLYGAAELLRQSLNYSVKQLQIVI